MVEANVTSTEILYTYRESFTIADAKQRCRLSRPAYSVVNLFCGALIDTLCAIRSMFVPMYGADIDKICRKMYIELTGRRCFSDVKAIPFERQRSPVLLCLTPSCHDYASSNPDPQGEHGDHGGDGFVYIPKIVLRVRPLVVFVEEVGNIINFEDELLKVLLGLQNDCDMVVHAAIVSMQQYGDIENCWRFPIVAFHKCLGHFAQNYRIPGVGLRM